MNPNLIASLGTRNNFAPILNPIRLRQQSQYHTKSTNARPGTRPERASVLRSTSRRVVIHQELCLASCARTTRGIFVYFADYTPKPAIIKTSDQPVDKCGLFLYNLICRFVLLINRPTKNAVGRCSEHLPTAHPPNVSGHVGRLRLFYHKFAFPHNTQGEANLFGGAAMQAGRTIVTDLNAHDCVCRVRRAVFRAWCFLSGVCDDAGAGTRSRDR